MTFLIKTKLFFFSPPGWKRDWKVFYLKNTDTTRPSSRVAIIRLTSSSTGTCITYQNSEHEILLLSTLLYYKDMI